MKTYKCKVTLVVEVPAFEESDAVEMVEDSFGAGPAGDMNIVESKIKVVEVVEGLNF
jgi:hypothetical protein